MNKFKLTVTEIILQIVSIILLFLPGFYTKEVWGLDELDDIAYTLQTEIPMTFITGLNNYGLLVFLLGIIVITSMIACAVLSLIWILNKVQINKFISCILRLIAIAGICLVSFMIYLLVDYPDVCSLGVLFYIVLSLQIIAFVLTIIKEFSKISDEAVKIKTSIGNADELKKYKELFDSGVITEHEFEAKKKKLLDI